MPPQSSDPASANPVQALLGSASPEPAPVATQQISSNPYAGLAEAAFDGVVNPKNTVTGLAEAAAPAYEAARPSGPINAQQRVEAGFKAGVLGLQSSGQYFSALTNTLLGDEDAAVQDINDAQQYEQYAEEALAGIAPFTEFLEEPSIGGFFEQFQKAAGMVAPSALTTIAGALATGGTSVVAQLVGKGVTKTASAVAARRIMKEAVEKTAKGTASPEEKNLANGLYSYLRTFKRGAVAGAAGSSFIPLSGQNLQEGLEAGRELDADLALRSLLVAAPQTAIDVGSELVILKSLGSLATSRAAGRSGIMAQLARDVASSTTKGAVTEGIAETSQEAISVANRALMDDTFTQQDAALRLAEAAFMGAAGGAGMGGAGGTISGSVRATRSVFGKANDLIQSAREQEVNEQLNEEEFGDLDTGNTTLESEFDLSGQFDAMFDPSSSKTAVWVAGDTLNPDIASQLTDADGPTLVDINGKRAYAAYVPGRGTIFGKKRLVEAVVKAGATDKALASALGYSRSKSATDDQVVQVADSQGRVIWEQTTNDEGLADAFAAAEAIRPEGAPPPVRKSVEDTLRERKARADAERPTVRGMQSDADEAADSTETPTFGSELEEIQSLRDELQSIGEVEGERSLVGTYAPKSDPTQVFDNTDEVRQAYEAEFGDTDFDSPELLGVSEAALRAATKESANNPNSVVEIQKTADGQFLVNRTDFDKLYRFEARGKLLRLTLPQFIEETVSQAKRSKFARQSSVVLKTPEGKSHRINLADLTNSGRRLVEGRGAGTFEGQGPYQSSRNGLFEILVDLDEAGYGVEILNQPIFEVLREGRVDSAFNVPAATIGGKVVGLADLINTRYAPTNPRFQTEEGRAEAESQARFDRLRAGRGAGYQMPLQTRSEDVIPGDRERQFESDAEKVIDAKNVGMAVPTTRQVSTEQTADNVSEAELFAGDPRDDISPDTRRGSAPSTYTPVSDINTNPRSPRGPEVLRAPDVVRATYPAGGVGSLAVQVINRALSKLRLKKPVAVLGVQQLMGMSTDQIVAMFNERRVAEAVIEQLQILLDTPSAQGRYLGFADAHFILVDNRGANELQTSLIAAHELGHALFEEQRDSTILNERGIYAALSKAFEEAKNKEGASPAYQGELGFEEWYADQVANWAQKLYLDQKAAETTNPVDSHFKRVAQRLVAMFRQLSSDFRSRFGKRNTSSDFISYMDFVVSAARRNRQSAYQRSAARNATFKQKVLIRAINDATAGDRSAVATAARVGKAVNRAINAPGGTRDFLKIVRTADGIIRGISAGIANMFYTKAQSPGQGGNLGFIRARDTARRRLQNDLEDIVGSDWSQQSVTDAFDEAAGDTATADLTGTAKEIRLFLERIYDEYVSPAPGNTIQKRPDYFPVALDISEIYADPKAFVQLVLRYNPKATEAKVIAAVNNLVMLQEHILADNEITVDPLNPASEIEAARKLTDNIPPSALTDFSLPPTEAALKYIEHVVKRVEWNKATKDAEGKDLLGPMLKKLPDENRVEAVKIIKTYLGYNTEPLNPTFRAINSWGQFLQFITILPFATIASVPEFAGAVINGKEFSAVTMAMKAVVQTVSNRQEAIELARDLGVSATAAMSNVFMSDAEAEFMSPAVRKMSDAYFKVIGLDFFTRFTREFASNMGVSFILAHAHNKSGNPRSQRYLRDLGLTADEVKAWEADGRQFNTEVGRKVRDGLTQFVENSMLRPNAAERPVWASDPRFALIWQLKGFLYSFGSVILGGIKREASTRIGEGGSALGALSGVGALLALAAVAYLPLAMLSMELREWAKYILAAGLPGVEADDTYFRSDRMDWSTYFGSALQTTYGPMTIASMMMQNSEWGGSAVTPLLGPTAETIETVLRDGWKSVPNRLLPVYNQL